MKPLIDNQKALIAIQIDPDFQRQLSAGQQAAVQVIAGAVRNEC
jgi:hypothetical protein